MLLQTQYVNGSTYSYKYVLKCWYICFTDKEKAASSAIIKAYQSTITRTAKMEIVPKSPIRWFVVQAVSLQPSHPKNSSTAALATRCRDHQGWQHSPCQQQAANLNKGVKEEDEPNWKHTSKTLRNPLQHIPSKKSQSFCLILKCSGVYIRKEQDISLQASLQWPFWQVSAWAGMHHMGMARDSQWHPDKARCKQLQ